MEILDKIADQVKKLDYNWFLAKRNQFEAEGLYNKETGKIDDSVPDAEEMRVYDITIKQYCWNSYFPDTSFPDDFNREQIDSKEIIDAIIELLRNELNIYTDNAAKHKLIEECKKLVTKTLSNNFAKHIEDHDYVALLYYIDDMWKKLLYKNYREIKQQYQLLNPSQDKLEFAIPKEQVAALIYFLSEAKILNVTSGQDMTPLDFVEKYFYYKKGKNPEYAQCSKLRRKYQDIIRQDSSSINTIKEKLRRVIK